MTTDDDFHHERPGSGMPALSRRATTGPMAERHHHHITLVAGVGGNRRGRHRDHDNTRVDFTPLRTKNMKKVIAAIGGLIIAGSSADASQVTLGNSTAGTFDFAGFPPSSSLTVASPGIGGTGTAFFPPDSGDYWFGPTAPFAAGPLVGGNFPTTGSQTFAVAMDDGDGLAGVVTWSLLKDHSAHPDLDGKLAITVSFGDPVWLASFPAGGSADIDLALTLLPGPLLDEIAADGGGQWATISSGEIVPIPHEVPEPNALMVLASALIGFFWLRSKMV